MFLFLHYSFAFCCEKSTLCPFNATGQGFRWTTLLFVVLSILAHQPIACAQVYDSFDDPRQKFRLWKSDAGAQLAEFRKTEPGEETIQASFRTGSEVYLMYPIEPCAVIEDLKASIRIFSAQSGLRIAFRVIFPRSANPVAQNPIAEVLFGTPTEGGGRWSTSEIGLVDKQLEDRIIYLRSKLGPSIDLRDAYVDAVLLSIYSDPGTIKLKVDDLQVEGMVAPLASDISRDFDADGLQGKSPLSVPEQLKNLQATVPRWIMHRGESLDYLKSLGFTAIITNNPTDPLIVEQSKRSQMGVIGRPPDLVPTESIAHEYRHVQGWWIGWTRDQSHLPQTRSLASRVARFPPSLTRPTVGEAMEMYGPYSRLSDLLAVPQPLSTRVRSASEAANIMRSELLPLVGRSIPLTSIVTQMPDEWMVQKSLATRIVGGADRTPGDYDLLQIRLQFYRSLMQGARGFIFRSGSALDSGDPTSLMRSESYAGINREIELMMPWIQAAQSSWRSVSTDSANHTATVLETPNSQLAIIIASGPMDQICSTAPTRERIQVTLPSSGQLRKAFRITHGVMELLRPVQTTNGMLVSIDKPGIVEQIVTTVDAFPNAYLTEQLARLRPGLVSSRLDITQQVLQTGEMLLISQQIPQGDSRWEEIRDAESSHRLSMGLLARSNVTEALKNSDQALLAAQRVVRRSWDEAAAQFGAFQSSPLVASPLSLPLHWEMNRLLAGRGWQSLPVPGVPFRDLDQFYQSNWQVDRRLTQNIESDCSIGAKGPDGNPTLLLATRPLNNQPIPTGYGGAVMRVTSPPVTAPGGAMIHIEGLVRIQSPAGETQSGLLVCDSIGGESLGQLISFADPSQYAWRRFSLIRFVTEERSVRMHFETRGEIRAEIADLKTEMIIPTQAIGLLTRPYLPEESQDANQTSLPLSTTGRR